MSRLMKHSGVKWIGDIPEHWKTGRYKYYVIAEKGKLPTTVNETGEGLPIIGASEMNGKTPKLFTKEELPSCTKDDILILWDGANAGLIAHGFEGIVSSTSVVFRKVTDKLNSKYLFYQLKSEEPFFRDKVNGTTIPHMNNAYIDELCALIPPLHEQHTIVGFLDAKCNEINTLVSLQEKMIDELQAYKQSVIIEAVTKGLIPNAKTKDSHQQWLGAIPSHWELRPLKYVFSHRREKNDPIKSKERLSLSIGAGVTLYSEKTTNLDRFKDDFTQYQLAYPNDIVLNCMNMIVGAVGRSDYFGCVSPVYYVIYPTYNDNPYYYAYLLNTPIIRNVYHALGQGIYAIERGEGRVNTCRLKVPYEDFGRIEIPVPPLEEQQEIADYLDKKCSEIDKLVSIKRQKIEELKDYKKSLIYEYATGKKQVI